MTQQDFLTALQERYPNAWFKIGDDFSSSGSHNGSIWSGEDACDGNGFPLFSPYNSNASYDLEVLKDLVAFSKKCGWYWESYDCGTFFAYEIS